MAETTLRSGLTARFIAAAVALLLLDGIACYLTAAHFANLVYDRWLIDSTRSLAQAITVADHRVRIDLPRVALQIFQFDEVDKTEFRILTARRGDLAGDATLPIPAAPRDGSVHLSTANVRNEPLRMVYMSIPEPAAGDTAELVVGETVHKRSALAADILLAMAAPQLGLLIVTLLLTRIAVTRGLQPLTTLARAIEERGHENLAPLSEANLPREARVLAAKINELLARTEHLVSTQQRFVTDAAHQLRTPLAAVMLYTDRAERATDRQSAEQALRGLRAVVARAARLSQQLLSLARAAPDAAARVPLSALDLVALARGVGEEWIPRALERKIDFGFVAPETPVMVIGNSGLLGELMSNLIDNALRYCAPHSRVTLSVSASPIPSLAVEDDGPGIPVAERAKIFERFYRLADGSTEGAGLGLAIVKEIATVHHAAAHVTSGRNGRGTCFRIEFPAAMREAS